MTNIGTSVFALKYKDGIMIAADVQVSYGSWLKHKDFPRMCKVGEDSLLACSGEMSDFQNLRKMLDTRYEQDLIQEDGALFAGPKEYHNLVGNFQYKKRMKGDPVFVSAVLAGIDQNSKQVFLGCSDSHGMKLQKDYFLTGLANHYCGVLFTNHWRPDMSEAEARGLIEECIKIMFIRDKKALDTIQISTITQANGVQLGEPYKVICSQNLPFFTERTNDYFRPLRVKW